LICAVTLVRYKNSRGPFLPTCPVLIVDLRITDIIATPTAAEKVPETMMDSKTDANLEEGSIMEKARTTSETYNATMSLDPVAERKLVWKLDLRLSELLSRTRLLS
jgi:hypothetical protein